MNKELSIKVGKWNNSILWCTVEKTSKYNKMFKVIITTQQQCINISILLWQHVLVILYHLQASI